MSEISGSNNRSAVSEGPEADECVYGQKILWYRKQSRILTPKSFNETTNNKTG